MSDSLTIARRFRGPESSGNGGYTCGLVAGFVPGEAQVTLRRPPPLDRPLAVTREGERVLVHDGPDLVAEAVLAHLDLEGALPHPGRSRGGGPRVRRLQPTTSSRDASCAVRTAPPSGTACGSSRARCRAATSRRPVQTDAALPAANGFLTREIAWSLLDCPGPGQWSGRWRRRESSWGA